MLGVSRRTVFRELGDADAILSGYCLALGTAAGRGLFLEGPGEGRSRLASDLELSGSLEPSAPQRRRTRLALSVIVSPEPRKLFWWADMLGVSVPTVSADLDRAEPWLASRGLVLLRDRRSGASVRGPESAMRRAATSLLLELKAPDGACRLDGSRAAAHGGSGGSGCPCADGFPAPEVQALLAALAPEIGLACAWMTPESREALDTFLAVGVQRRRDGRVLGESPDKISAERIAADGEAEARLPADGEAAARVPAEAGTCSVPDDPSGRVQETAGRVVRSLESAFGPLPPAERAAIVAEIASCRANTGGGPSAGDRAMEELALRMIDAFDPASAGALKLDQVLVGGLAAHMRPALARLASGMRLEDPLLDQMEARYPDILAGSARALAAAAGPGGFGDGRDASEAGFLAMHFGAAVQRLEERGTRRRAVSVGVVCVNGIGTSYLLAEQVKRRFAGEASVEVSGWGSREEWEGYELLVSAGPLEGADVPHVRVPPILDEVSVGMIAAEIARIRSGAPGPASGAAGPGALASRCSRLEALLADARAVMDGFVAVEVDASCPFGELAGEAARLAAGLRRTDLDGTAGRTPPSGTSTGTCPGPSERERLVLDGLTERERMSSQVIPELGLVLLHSRTEGVTRPLIALLQPRGGAFADPYFRGAKACVLMLVHPRSSPECREMMGSVSAALLNPDGLLGAVLRHDAPAAEAFLEGILEDFLEGNVVKIWKGQAPRRLGPP
jgi:mannitol operon transcriptional antiterminator